jgi:hypothetical protein
MNAIIYSVDYFHLLFFFKSQMYIYLIVVALIGALKDTMRCVAYCGKRLMASDKQVSIHEFDTSVCYFLKSSSH